MFDLEQAIAEWRRQMIAGGIKTPVPLEELESHLREDIEGQTRAGATPEQAFAVAVRRLGDAGHLKKEFEKVQSKKDRRRNLLRVVSVFLGATLVYAATFGTWIVASREGRIEITRVDVLLVLGSMVAMISIGLVGRNVAKRIPVIIREWRQAAATFGVFFVGALLLSLVWSRLDWNSLVHIQIVGLWTMSPMLGLLHGFCAWCEKCDAARKQTRAMNA